MLYLVLFNFSPFTVFFKLLVIIISCIVSFILAHYTALHCIVLSLYLNMHIV